MRGSGGACRSADRAEVVLQRPRRTRPRQPSPHRAAPPCVRGAGMLFGRRRDALTLVNVTQAPSNHDRSKQSRGEAQRQFVEPVPMLQGNPCTIKPAANRVSRPIILAIAPGHSRYRGRTRRSLASPVVVSRDSTIIAPAIPRNPASIRESTSMTAVPRRPAAYNWFCISIVANGVSSAFGAVEIALSYAARGRI